jgi:ketosteroid isomerase-like protein
MSKADRDQEITATLQRLAEAFNRGDFEAAMEIAHPEIEFVRSWEKRTLRGPAAVREWMEPDAFEDQRIELRKFTLAGDKVLVNQHLQARGAGSGIEVDVDSWAIWTLDAAGLATRLEIYLHHEEAEAREAAGLSA